jgi:hypothetical protein
MGYRLAADALLVLHGMFIVFALLGGLLALRWRWVPWLQLPCAAWALFVELSGRLCPLTTGENAFRQRAGDSGYPGGFIEHYLVPLIYPAGLTRELQWLLAALLLLVNVAAYAWAWRRRRLR